MSNGWPREDINLIVKRHQRHQSTSRPSGSNAALRVNISSMLARGDCVQSCGGITKAATDMEHKVQECPVGRWARGHLPAVAMDQTHCTEHGAKWRHQMLSPLCSIGRAEMYTPEPEGAGTIAGSRRHGLTDAIFTSGPSTINWCCLLLQALERCHWRGRSAVSPSPSRPRRSTAREA